jgi:hypothetical protein
MDTAPLKSFATWARTALIREVTGRIAVVLAPASSERIEQRKAVAVLEKAVNAAGGGEKGRSAVADRVAYTWFNRIIALRFMDANGYTGIGVVSPQAGVEVGQPEILAEAKRANIDPEVVSQPTRDSVTGLLNGTRRSDYPQGEAYALLLAEYCRRWNRAMPFMFERAGDFTELLIPANLLADDSVLNRAVKVLTADVCQDVEVIGWLYQFYISERKDEVFAGFKKGKKAGAEEIPAATQLFTPHWIVRYLVENSLGRLWMLNRPTSRLVDQMEYYIAPVDAEPDYLKINSPEELKIIDPACGSGHMLTYAFDFLYSIYEEEGYAPSDIPGLILAKNLYGTEIDPRAGALAAFALTMKARARQRTFFNKQVEPNVCVLEPIRFTPQELDFLLTAAGDREEESHFWNLFANANVFGALIQADSSLSTRLSTHLADGVEVDGDLFAQDIVERAGKVLNCALTLASNYSVVVTNPPYMGSRNMGSALSARVKDNYPSEKQDLYGCFVARGVSLAVDSGLVAMVIGDTWMTLKSFEDFRRKLLRECTFETFVHVRDVSNHPDIFGANVAFVFSNMPTHHQTCTFVHLDPLSADAKQDRLLEAVRYAASPWSYRTDPEQFDAIPGSPIAYWLPKEAVRAYADFDSLGDHSYGQPGLQTSDNGRFIRFWYEVDAAKTNLSAESSGAAKESGATWFLLVKGGDFRKWFGNLENVVDWEDGGARIKASINEKYPYLKGNVDYVVKDRGYFFRASLTYNKITSGRFTARFAPVGSIFDVAGSAIFPHSEPLLALAFLGSTTGEFFVHAQNPTLNVQSGDIARLPYPQHALADRSPLLISLVSKAIQVSARDWDSVETAWGFASSPLVPPALDPGRIANRVSNVLGQHQADRVALAHVECGVNAEVAAVYGLEGHVPTTVDPAEVTLRPLDATLAVSHLASYAVGCMFGRYSLDEPGLILADHGATIQDYLAKVSTPTFTPDADNVVPIVDGDWFEDDIVARFRQFLRVAFGEEHFEENVRFVTESLGVKDLRDYFVKSFYKDHVQRYKKRPIYWLFSSPRGSFNALIYMHRYTPSTVSTVLNEYLREFKAKLRSSLQNQERLVAGGGTARQLAAAQKEADRLRKVLVELDEYEHDILYPLASQQIEFDLDDGVKVNYPKFGAALKKIPGLDAAE